MLDLRDEDDLRIFDLLARAGERPCAWLDRAGGQHYALGTDEWVGAFGSAPRFRNGDRVRRGSVDPLWQGARDDEILVLDYSKKFGAGEGTGGRYVWARNEANPIQELLLLEHYLTLVQ